MSACLLQFLKFYNYYLLNILRKEYKKETKEYKQKLIDNSEKNIIFTTEINEKFVEKNIFDDKTNKLLTNIKEINVFKDIKTVHYMDTQFINRKNISYQFGVKVNVSNGFYTYIKNILNELSVVKNNIQNYYNTTLNLLNYNPVRESYTDSFIDSFSVFYRENLLKSINKFIEILEQTCLLERLNEQEADELSLILSTCLDPVISNQYLINKVLMTISSIHSEIEKELEKIKNINLNKEFWFNEIVNIPENLSTGYSYFPKKQLGSGMLSLNSSDILSRIRSEIEFYSSDSVQGNILFCISPKYISINNSEYIIDKNMTNDNYKKLDIQIKLFNKKMLYKNNDEDLLNILNSSFSILNYYSEGNDYKQQYLKSGDYQQNKNLNVQIENLFLSFVKTSFGTKNFNMTNVPFQVKSLIDQKSNIFSNISTAFDDLNNNSKFLFLYNTLCHIEYMKTNGDIEDINTNTWHTLTTDTINKLNFEEKILCRLKLYQMPDNKYFSRFSEINLLSYDNYFILHSNVQPVTTQQTLIQNNETIISQKIDKIDVNLINPMLNMSQKMYKKVKKANFNIVKKTNNKLTNIKFKKIKEAAKVIEVNKRKKVKSLIKKKKIIRKVK